MSYGSEVLADSPLAYWRLGDQSGTTAEDATVNNRDGTYTGGFTLQAGGLIANDADDSTSFNGSTGFVNLGTNIFSPLLNGASQVTIEAWILPNSIAATQRPFSIILDGASTIGVGMRVLLTSGNIELRGRSVSTDADQIATSTSPVAAVGKLMHIVGVFDYPNDRIRLYINGKLIVNQIVTFANNSYTAGTPTTADAIGYINGTEFFNGLIDEVAIYNTELSATRILTHWNEGTQNIMRDLFHRRILDVFAATSNPIVLINKTLFHQRPLPIWAGDTTGADSGSSSGVLLYQVPVNGSISGTVKVNGVAVRDRTVRLYYRKHGTIVGFVKTDETGTFTFLNLNPSDKYTAIAFDDLDTAPDFNAKIFDILTPV